MITTGFGHLGIMAETAAIAVFFKVPYHPHQKKIRMTQLNSLSLLNGKMPFASVICWKLNPENFY